MSNVVVCVCDGLVVGKENPAPLSQMIEEKMELLQPPIIR